ncbi:MAG: hypothetical protein KGK10_09280 [Rhodospirillales bacterium]|nr:hypothetical protein [Rhodospirillales bacterium]
MAALGRFVGEWANVESALDRLYSAITGVGHPGEIAFDRLPIKDKTEILPEIAGSKIEPPGMSPMDDGSSHRVAAQLTKDQQKRLASFCEQAKNLSQKRNKIIHSVWGCYNNKWYRIYRNITTEPANRIFGADPSDQRFRDTNTFDIKSLLDLSKRSSALEEVGRQLANEIRPLMNTATFVYRVLWRGAQLELPLDSTTPASANPAPPPRSPSAPK